MIYGTAWKKDRTASLVQCAIEKGFRGIDTALQPEHYDEGLACEGVRLAITGSHGKLQRDSIYVSISLVCSAVFRLRARAYA